MAAEPLALSTVPPPSTADADYEAICAAVTATARGRWFLDQFAKRNRNSDTGQVLAAIARMEAAVAGERAQQASREAHQEVRIELLEMARTIAQARAEAAESRPASPQQPAVEPASTATPEVAAAAERLRQIAWTLRACGVDLPASEQIAEIAGAILSAEALRDLGEQRAQKLTEALHYLEHRIDRMLDGHRAAPGSADAEPAAPATEPKAAARDTALTTMAVAMIAAAMKPDAGPAEAAAAIPAAPMDDDVVLTVADGPIEPEPESAPAVCEEPVVARVEPEPVIEPRAIVELKAVVEPKAVVELEPVVEPEPVAEPIAPPLPMEVATAPAEIATAQAQAARAGLEVEPLLPALPSAADDEAVPFAGLELEPLTIEPAATEAAAEPAMPDLDDPDSGANDNRPLMLVTTVTATGATQVETIAMQVDQDLDSLVDDSPFADVAATGAPVPQQQPVESRAPADDDPAEPLVEPPPRGAPVSALVASSQASRAQLSDTLAAIENELFGSTRPDAHGNPPESIPAPAPKPAAAPAASSPLAALMAMSDEERIALFS